MNLSPLRVFSGIIFSSLIFSQLALAQTNVNEEQGLKPYDSLHGGDLDSVSLTGGGLSLHIPLVSFPQRGNLDLSFFLRYSSKGWTVKATCTLNPNGVQSCTYKWIPARGISGALVVSSLDWWIQGGASDVSSWATVSSPDGNVHQLGGENAGANGQVGPLVYPSHSLDATGLLQLDANTLIMSNGTRYSYVGGLGSQQSAGFQPTSGTDANGNQITISSSGWTDTLGRLIPGSATSSFAPIQPGVPTSDLSNCPSGTSSALVWNVPGVAAINSGVRTFKFCYSMVTLQTNFQQSGVSEYGPVSTSMLSGVVLPNLSLWTLSYDSYGDVLTVGFPVGGSISYTYATLTSPNCTTTNTQVSRWITSRTVNANDGTGGHTWNYAFTPGSKTTVSSPDGNDAVHTIIAPVQGCICNLYDSQVQYYQGSATSGTLLKTVATQFSAAASTYDVGEGPVAVNVVPTQITTTWVDGNSSKIVNAYDSGGTDANGSHYILGSLLERDEYDYSNTLVRSTVNQYLWQNNSTYFNDNIVSLVSSTTLKNGSGTQVAQTTYGYDEVAVVPSGISTASLVAPPAGGNIRGNRTTISHWLDSSNSFLSSTATYFDTGMLASSAPPANADGLNRTTTYTYSSTFLGAYLTQTNMPDTQMPDSGAPLVHHIISGNYDFNTGLLTGFTDENSQVFSYQYDIMLRLTQGNHPDGGQTLFTYPDPNTVTRQRLISGTTYDSFTAKFDGVGRNYETLQAVPGATVEVDTTFDSLGRISTVSNPYFQGTNHSSDPTYGVIQTQYDALSRVIKTIKQDGSASSAHYNAPPGDGLGSLVECTTGIDEAGKQRQSCVDALGRLTKVIEPNPGAPATNATGWISVSGSEQSAQTQPAKSGSGTVTINGTEQSGQYCMLRCVTIYDSGNVTVTVNGFGKTVSYGRYDTGSTIASSLANAFNGDGNSPVNASASSNVLTLTAKASGSATNYPLSSSSATTDTTGTFSSPSFTPSNGSSLTGGQNAATTSDSGTVTATINGTNYTVNFGASDTASSIASNLANAINGGSWASATVSGSTVNMTSKTPGTAGDYSLGTLYTWNSSQFTNPSFTTSKSGTALSGALDAGAINNNPYVTTYQYNVRGDMLCVHQKATDTTADVACTGTTPPSVPAAWRQRFFSYDSLSRLLTAMNPETSNGTGAQITYAYDADSNVISKTEPAPNQAWGASPMQTLTISYTYDALNRLLNTTYSDGITPNTVHRYDYASYLGQNFAYPVGREVAATSGNGAQYFTSYEQMGRVAQTVQCTPGVAVCQTFRASYDKLGDLATLNYPGNAFTITYGYDSAARLTTATDSNGVTYAQNPTFLASGAVQEFISPNFNNNKYHVDYNNRLQPTEIWTGSAEGASALFDKQYQYNPPNTSQMNNGNIYTVTNVKDSTRTQTFTYDYLDRLTSAGDQAHWYNSYTYDAWGNLTQKSKGNLSGGESLSTSTTSNNQLLGYSYDAAGNMLKDGINSWTYVYDAENRITAAGSVTYRYDADGRRVTKSSGTNYWYGPMGTVLAETDSSGNWTNYILFAGQLLARNVPQPSPNPADIKYYITDHLHSTAIFADKSGTILDDNDFYPWGGVIPGVGQTTSNNTVKFTGKYRDTESQLDYFGARYYENATGRFMTPDWAAKPRSVPYAEFGDPQSLNLYSYVRNSPIARTDADGHTFVVYDTPLGTERPGDGGDPYSSNDDRYDVTTTYTRIYVNGTLIASIPTSQTIQHVGSSTFLYSGKPIIGEGSPKNLQTRQRIASLAVSRDGSTDWAYSAAKPDDKFPANSNKCNLFVYDTTKDAGADPSLNRKWPMPLAAEWANSNFKIPNWRVLGDDESPQAGDVAAYKISGYHPEYTGHSGIIVDAPGGGAGSISAHDDRVGPISTTQFFTETDVKVVYRRYTGD